MSLVKLLPVAAMGLAGAAGVMSMKDNADIIGQFKVKATLHVEMQGIADAVAMDYVESEELPMNDFPNFLRENLREAKGMAFIKGKSEEAETKKRDRAV